MKFINKNIMQIATKVCGIYIIQSPSGSVYVGQTKNFISRIWQHESDFRNRNGRYRFLHESLNFHGIKKHEIKNNYR